MADKPAPFTFVGDDITDDRLDELAALLLDGRGRPDIFLRMFGLANCADTPVGSAMVRGISGGERKRLSTLEMLMSRQRVCIMDEISTGLVRVPVAMPDMRFARDECPQRAAQCCHVGAVVRCQTRKTARTRIALRYSAGSAFGDVRDAR